MAVSKHIVSAYDKELAGLRQQLADMAKLVLSQLRGSMQCLAELDKEAAARLYAKDQEVDALERKIDENVVSILARRQPLADDLRLIVVALKLGNSLARIGDYAKNIARRVPLVRKIDDGQIVKNLLRMSSLVSTMIEEVLRGLDEENIDTLTKVWESDGEVDAMFTVLNRTLITYILGDAREITACAHLMFVAKNLERIGDHATNMAEHGYFYLTGQILATNRPKTNLFDKELTPLKKKDIKHKSSIS